MQIAAEKITRTDPEIEIINDHLGDTIIAALMLGDLDLIQHDLQWTQDLMANHNISSFSSTRSFSFFDCDQKSRSLTEIVRIRWRKEYSSANFRKRAKKKGTPAGYHPAPRPFKI